MSDTVLFFVLVGIGIFIGIVIKTILEPRSSAILESTRLESPPDLTRSEMVILAASLIGSIALVLMSDADRKHVLERLKVLDGEKNDNPKPAA